MYWSRICFSWVYSLVIIKQKQKNKGDLFFQEKLSGTFKVVYKRCQFSFEYSSNRMKIYAQTYSWVEGIHISWFGWIFYIWNYEKKSHK